MDDATILPPTKSSDDLNLHAAGDLIDNRYKVIRELGRGGMGVVYEVDDTLVSERLALKRLLPNQQDSDSVTAFVQAGNASRKFSGRSRRFVSTHTLGKDALGPYLVLELITAPTLRTLMRGGGIASLDLAMTILRDIAQGLVDLHEEGYVHRDIKPDNIFVQDGGKVLLADFGISKDMASSAGTMLPGALSRNYGSPEQAKGLPTTQASDIYAFGAVAYELFSGDAPYGAIEPLTELVPGIEKGISDLVMRCLAQRPERRPQNGEELLVAWDKLPFNNVLDHRPNSIIVPTGTLQEKKVEISQTFEQSDVQKIYLTQASSTALGSNCPLGRDNDLYEDDAEADVDSPWQERFPHLKLYLDSMCVIPDGEFLMGSRKSYIKAVIDGTNNELPAHRVKLTSFRIGAFPVTSELWREFLADIGESYELVKRDLDSRTANHPVVNISWDQVAGEAYFGGFRSFCEWATASTGIQLLLPTEAQWEYAARGGKQTLYPWGDEVDVDKLWCSVQKVTHRTSTASLDRSNNVYKNAYGLIDMVGNVSEFCRDWLAPYRSDTGVNPLGPPSPVNYTVSRQGGNYVGHHRVIRGGSFGEPMANCTCTTRTGMFDNEKFSNVGFRLVSK